MYLALVVRIMGNFNAIHAPDQVITDYPVNVHKKIQLYVISG